MILYTYTGGPKSESRYYFSFWHYIRAQIFPDLEASNIPLETPFLPALQTLATSTPTETQANQFLRDFYPYPEEGAFVGINIWPLPIYGNNSEERANNLIVRKFLIQYLFPKYWESFLLPFGKDNSPIEEAEVWRIWFNRFMQLMVATFNKYCPILKAYEAKENSLMARLGSESHTISRFNDTPQEGGDFADEDHTTNATTADNETASDYETPINRLREIRDKFENIYNAWARDFDILFTQGESNGL